MRGEVARALRWAGHGLSLAGLAFLAWRGATAFGHLGGGGEVMQRLLAATGWYVMAMVPLCAGWLAALDACGERPRQWLGDARAHLGAQIAKYIPGNIFHFAARHLRARELGHGHAGLVAAAGLESALLVLAALAWTLALPTALWPPPLQMLAAWRDLGLWAGVGVLLAALVALRPWVLDRWGVRLHPGAALLAFALHGLFFLLASASFAGALPAGSLGLGERGAVVALAWLAGFIVPGAPGGLGVREAVLVLLLRERTGEAEAVQAAALFRLATLATDAATYVLAAALGRWQRPGMAAESGTEA